jgi:5-hydroxyisourate hydrolase
MKTPITTHVLDTAEGAPAANLDVVVERRGEDGFREVGRGTTDEDGRITELLHSSSLEAGVYRITFFTGPYFDRLGTLAFYPEVSVVFTVPDGTEHYHVPLLLSPFGYSTYRGS